MQLGFNESAALGPLKVKLIAATILQISGNE